MADAGQVTVEGAWLMMQPVSCSSTITCTSWPVGGIVGGGRDGSSKGCSKEARKRLNQMDMEIGSRDPNKTWNGNTDVV